MSDTLKTTPFDMSQRDIELNKFRSRADRKEMQTQQVMARHINSAAHISTHVHLPSLKIDFMRSGLATRIMDSIKSKKVHRAMRSVCSTLEH